MPDGTQLVGIDAAEAATLAEDERLLSHVGRRLVVWASGTTLIVLIVLGVVLYAAVNQSLEATGLNQLDLRAKAFRNAIEAPGGRPDGGDVQTGAIFGGGTSGTFGIVVAADGTVIVPRVLPATITVNRASLTAATVSGRDVREGTVGGAPVRILTTSVNSQIGTIYVQIFQDRIAEQRTLSVLLAVLLGGGVVVLIVAAGVGVLYSRRALIPIRSSLASQRRALRRQREFAADASHELRTPLTVVRSSLELLRRHPEAPVREYSDVIDDVDAEVEHLTGLVEDLLLLARTDSGAVELEHLPLDLGDVVADGASSLVPSASQRDVHVSVEPAPVIVVGDAARLRQLVVILVDNAIRHSPRGGTVRVTVGTDGTSGTFSVADEGPGIREEDRAHVFERFWRAPGAPAGGSGLGLAIASWIVSGLGGGIDVTNEEGAGARFTVRMPLETSAATS